MSAGVDPGLIVRDSEPLDISIQEGHDGLAVQAAAFAAVTVLVLFLSALGIFSLVSIGVSRRTREIGLRAALGAHPRQVLTRILSHATVLMLSGVTAGGSLVLLVSGAVFAPIYLIAANICGVLEEEDKHTARKLLSKFFFRRPLEPLPETRI